MIDCITHIGRNRSIINEVRADRSDLSRIPMGHKRTNRSLYNVKRVRRRRSSELICGVAKKEKRKKKMGERKKERKRGQLLVTITST